MPTISDTVLLTIKVPRAFKKDLREKARKLGFVTVAAYIRSLLRASMRGHPAAPEAGASPFEALMHFSTGISVRNLDTMRLDMANPAHSRMHGREPQEMKGMLILDLYPPEFREEAKEHLKMARQLGSHCYISKHLRKDGSTFPVLVEMTIKTVPGKGMLGIANVQDLSRIVKGR